jgi:GTP-binding protein Era
MEDVVAAGHARETDADDESAADRGAETEGPPPVHRAGFVAVVGRPNVGKSTLTNALVGEKVAIVSPRPQTTRRRVLAIVTTPDAQAVLVDTPGIHRPRTALGRQMVAVGRRAIPDADVVVWVVDVSVPPTDLDRSVAGALRAARADVVVALNKSDRLRPEHVLEHVAAYEALAASERSMLTTATTGANVPLLWDLVRERLPEGPALYPGDQLTDQTDRALVAELVRESALKALYQEVPHGIEVVVVGWQERESGLVHIDADVLVERESHKAIVIGAEGRTIKAIGTAARRAIEAMLDRRVYLTLHVRVRAGWRNSPAEIRRLGFQ